MQNSFLQKVVLTMFWGLCAAGLVEFYKKVIWQANEDVNGAKAVREIYGDSRQYAHPTNKNSQLH